MKKNIIRRIAIILVLLQTLTLSGCKNKSNTEFGFNTRKSNIESEYWYDTEGNLHGLKEVKPIVTYTIEPYTSFKNTNGKIEKVTAYKYVSNYSAPSCATRVEGSGANIKCYVDYLQTENNNELKLTR